MNKTFKYKNKTSLIKTLDKLSFVYLFDLQNCHQTLPTVNVNAA